ncbi:MAG TPA: hypothetical protein VGK25_13590, partial [Ignavibacteria bacterium]
TEFATAVITNNIITENGWRKEWVCPQVGLWMNAPSSRFQFTYNDVWNNVSGDYKDIGSLTGINGNISENPEFKSKFDFTLEPGSELFHSGNPIITNLDGSRSHLGIEGGQGVK